MKRWSVSPQGKLHMVADVSGALLKVAFPFAWTMIMPAMDRPGFVSWVGVAVLYLVHRIALSGATHGEGTKRKIMQIDAGAGEPRPPRGAGTSFARGTSRTC